MSHSNPLYLCLTTVGSQVEADQIAEKVIAQQLAACVQIESPITSVYRWQGKIERETEFRISLFVVAENLEKLERFVHQIHPYDTPKWICLAAEKVSEKYLKWANEVSNLRGFI